jgi:hypothetical protein
MCLLLTRELQVIYEKILVMGKIFVPISHPASNGDDPSASDSKRVFEVPSDQLVDYHNERYHRYRDYQDQKVKSTLGTSEEQLTQQ